MIQYSELLKKLVIDKIKNEIIHGNNLEVLKLLPDNFINMCITSPPYYGLRKYETENVVWGGNPECNHEWEYYTTKGISGGKNSKKVQIKGKENYQIVKPSTNAFCKNCSAWFGELGQEPSVELYVSNLANIFDQVKRVLTPDGSFYLNISDSIMNSSKPKHNNIGTKSMMGVPERLMIELINRGWILRNKIIWDKNAVPESMKDRFTRTWEYLYFFTKNENYYFEQQLEEATYKDNRLSGMERNAENYRKKVYRNLTTKEKLVTKNVASSSFVGHSGGYDEDGKYMGTPGFRNVRDIWKIPTQPFIAKKYGFTDIDHFAVFPEKLVRIPIKASVPESGIILDPFMGSGTTMIECIRQKKNYIGIELNKDFIKMAEARRLEFQDSEEIAITKMSNNLSKLLS